jgi:hypothetical protein
MTKAFLNRSIAPRVLFRGSRTRKFQQYFVLLLFGAFAGSAFAERALTYNDGDLVLGFRATDRTNDYLVNIGQPAQFVKVAPGSTFQIDLGNASADLTTAFGSDWFTRIDPKTGRNAVLWSVVGGRQVAASGDPANTLYSTNPSSTPWARHSDTAHSFTTSLIMALGNTLSGNNSTTNNLSGLIQNAVSSNSYATFQPGGTNSRGISFQTWNPANEAVPVNQLFFNRITPGSGAATALGVFTLSSGGQLSFSAGSNPVGNTPNISTRK